MSLNVTLKYVMNSEVNLLFAELQNSLWIEERTVVQIPQMNHE